MKPQKFQIGQAVTPVHNTSYSIVAGPHIDNFPTPKYGEIYHVSEYTEVFKGIWFMILVEMSAVEVRENDFAPVLTDDQLESMLSEITEPATV